MSTAVRTHAFLPDPALRRDWHGQAYCASCGLPKRHQSHEVEGLPEDAVERDARRLGESSEEGG